MSKFFKMEEFTRSRTAEALKIKNTPSKAQKELIEWVMVEIADRIREKIGGPLYITSGFRSEKLNRAVGGVEDSYHSYNDRKWAFDCVAKELSLDSLMETIISLSLPVDKLILESDQGCVHVQGKRPDYLYREVISGKKIYTQYKVKA